MLTLQSCLQSCGYALEPASVAMCAARLPLCSQQDSRRPSKASRLVGAVASCFEAAYRLPKRCSVSGAWSTLLTWGLHVHERVCAARLVCLFPCVRLSLEAASILLKASTPRNDTCSSGKVFAPCSEVVPFQQTGGSPCIDMKKYLSFLASFGPLGSKM